MNVFHLPGICAQVVIDHWLYISWSRPMKKPLWGVNNGSNKIHRFVLVSSLDMLLITWLYKEWKLWGTLSVNDVSHWNLIINFNIFDLMDRWGLLECIITFSLSRYILSVLTRSLQRIEYKNWDTWVSSQYYNYLLCWVVISRLFALCSNKQLATLKHLKKSLTHFT